MKFGLCIVIVLNLVGLIGGNKHAQTIKPDTNEETQQEAATNVIKRLIGDKANKVAVKINFELAGNSFKILKTNDSEILQIEASNGVSACKGFYYYLKNVCKGHISWDGNRVPSLDEFPVANIEVKASSEIIYYQNVCTHSYSFTWWKWKDWRRHIDWIAFSGITLTLAPFQEDVWMEVYDEYGLTQDQIVQHLAGPGFFAWQRMGNLRGWGGKLSPTFTKFASGNQKKMINALNELGISVALPAFDGHLPVQFQKLFPAAKFSIVERWNDFPDEYCCPLFVEPLDPLFQEIGEKFLKKVTEKYGTNHIYFSDPFNEVQPKIAEANYLKNVSKSIYSAMSAVDPKAIWLLQGWMLVRTDQWPNNLVEAFLTAVPKGSILVLDLQSEQRPQYNRTNSFYGQPFIWCMLHNFGGTLGMHGSISYVNKEIPRAASMEGSTMLGVGITPEGINQNYVVYEYALEKAWHHHENNPKKWLKLYAQARYGFESRDIEQAWMLLLKSVYAYAGDVTIHGKYTICRRPSLKIQPLKWYDEKLVKKALKSFIAVTLNDTLTFNEMFRHDLIDLSRQFMQNQGDSLYLQIVDAYKKKNIFDLMKLRASFNGLLQDLDFLLGSHQDFMLGRFLESAKAVASNDDERKIFEYNARNQITIWGPSAQINDYATKQWNGIVGDYYLPRWKFFFAVLIKSVQEKTSFNQKRFQEDVFKLVELPFNFDNKSYPTTPKGNPVELARKMFKTWSKIND